MAERGHGAISNVTTMVADFGMKQAWIGLYGSIKAALACHQILGRPDFGPAGGPSQRGQPRPTRTEGTSLRARFGSASRRGPGLGGTRLDKPDESPAGIRVPRERSGQLTVHGVVLARDGGGSPSNFPIVLSTQHRNPVTIEAAPSPTAPGAWRSVSPYTPWSVLTRHERQ